MPEEEKPTKAAWAASAADQIRIESDNLARIYANNFTVALTNWDAVLTFGQIVGSKDDKPVIEETAKISMALPLLKAIHQMVGEHLGIFEKNFGDIKIPDIKKMVVASPEASRE